MTYSTTGTSVVLNTEFKVKPTTIVHGFTMSSMLLDKLIHDILEADLDDTVEIPSSLGSNSDYGRDLRAYYRDEDIKWMEDKLNTSLTPNELCVLDSLARWAYRNTGDLMRRAIGLIGSVISCHSSVSLKDTHVQANETGPDVYSSLIAENIWAIRRLIKSSTTVGAIDAKIPLHSLADTFEQLTSLPAEDRLSPNPIERERQAKLMASVSPMSNLSENSMDRVDFAAARLIQMTKSVASYKREDGFGRLRSFMTNGSTLASLIRVKAAGNIQLVSLCSDVLDIFHSIDRLLNANCIAANGLLDRMCRGELIYDEVLSMGKQQHRIMAVEYANAITLFAYLLKQSDLTLGNDQDIKKSISRLLRFSGITEQYTREILAKQYNAK